MLVEMLVALLLLTTVATMVPLLLRTVYQQRQQERFCRYSQLELANIAERLRSTADEGAPPNDVVLSDWFQSYCPTAELQLAASENPGVSAGLKSYQISISRLNGDNRPASIQALTVWIENTEEPSE